MRVGLHLTDRCQLDCDHCVRDPGLRPVDLPLGVIDAILAEAAASFGIRRVSMTGGEPTLHPQFAEILDVVVAHGMTWDIVSNGRRFERMAAWFDEAPARRRACRTIAFSVDGATDATHDAIRGRGQRREVLAAMAVAVSYGVPFSVTTTLHARNVGEIEAIARDAADLGAQSVRFAMMQPTGTHLDDELRLSAAQWIDAHDRIRALVGTATATVVEAEGWPSDRVDHVCGPLRGETLHVDHHGRLTLCCAQSQAPGDESARTIAGDVRSGLAAPMAALAAIREETIAAQCHDDPGHPWQRFGCNACLARFGRPHWTSEGVAGAIAARERWRGAWAPAERRKKNLPLLP